MLMRLVTDAYWPVPLVSSQVVQHYLRNMRVSVDAKQRLKPFTVLHSYISQVKQKFLELLQTLKVRLRPKLVYSFAF